MLAKNKPADTNRKFQPKIYPSPLILNTQQIKTTILIIFSRENFRTQTMKLLETQETLIITEVKINDLNTIKSKIESRLKPMKVWVYISDSTISFSSPSFYFPSCSEGNRADALRIIKEGTIEFHKEHHSLHISWVVKLDSMYFLALCISVFAKFVMSLLLNIELVPSVSVAFILFLLLIYLGTQFIKDRMTELINSCVYKNY